MKTNKAELYSSKLLDDLRQLEDSDETKKVEKRMLLAAKIDDAMQAKNLNKSEFAALMKQKNSVITKWLSGTHNFTIDTLFDIESKLNVKLVKLDLQPNIIIRVFKAEAKFDVANNPANNTESNIDINYFTNLYCNHIKKETATFNAEA